MIFFQHLFNYRMFFLILAPLLWGCTSSSEEEEEMQEADVVVSQDLVGNWTGSVDGSLGNASAVFSLDANGTLTAETDSEVLCPLEGTWSVAGKNFSATVQDECDGTGITMRAPASKTVLNGTWTASSGNSGTFRITKQ
jgi:hypothetical protein